MERDMISDMSMHYLDPCWQPTQKSLKVHLGLEIVNDNKLKKDSKTSHTTSLRKMALCTNL